MTAGPEAAAPASPQPAHASKRGLKLEFEPNDPFRAELRKRVDEYFQRTGRPRQDCWEMYAKTVVVLACFVASYLLLVFVAQTWWQGLLLALAMGLCTAGIGFNIQHDAGHKAYSKHAWVNGLMAFTLDLIGGSSYVWRWKHAVIHHNYVNITGYDYDIDVGGIARFTPRQPQLPIHRWQHLYMWPLYGLLVIKWQLVTDFRFLITSALGPHELPRPRGWDLAVFFLGKALFFGWAFVLPMFFHPVWVVLLFYVVAASFLGVLMSVVFQIPHCAEQADFPIPSPKTGRMETPWGVHQVNVTLDFARKRRATFWFVGGLNFHREHHLFPVICHINYPALSGIVEQTCRDFGLKSEEHPTFWGGVAAHYRWLKKMGREGAE